MSDKFEKLSAFFASLSSEPSKPCHVPEGYVLNERQKAIIALWETPMATTSATCKKCKRMYSTGFLTLCEESFCGWDEPEEPVFRPRKLTDEELQKWYGFSRKDLK
jgi:hypothetical protein